MTTIPRDYPGGVQVVYDAVNNCDNDYLIPHFEDACIYFKAAFQDPSPGSLLRALWTSPPSVKFRLFHGLQDPYTNPKSVMALDQENIDRKKQNLPSLDLTVRYYLGGHGYVANPAMVQDLEGMLENSLSKE